MTASARRTGAAAAWAAVALLLLGCRQTIHSQVSAFNQLPRQRHGLTYAMIALREQRTSRDFKAYVARVNAHLAAHGFVPEELDRAEFIVAMAYAPDDGGKTMLSYPIIGQSGSSASRMSGTLAAYTNTTSYSASAIHTSAYDGNASADDDADERQRVLRLDIVRRSSLGRGHIEKVYEGEVLSSGASGELTEIVPAMIEALFADFPGRDGEVRHVALKSVSSIQEIARQPATQGCPKDAVCTSSSSPTRAVPVRSCGSDRSGKLTCASRPAKLSLSEE